MDASDASWHGIDSVRMFLRIDMPPLDRVRGAMRRLATDSPVGTWYDRDRPVRRAVKHDELDGWLDRTLIRVDEDLDDLERAVAMQSAPLEDLPLRIMIGPSWMTVRQNHAVGDGWTSIHLLSHLLRQAASPDPVDLPWTEISSRRRSWLTAGLVARHPAGVVRAMARRKQLGGGPYELATIETAGLLPTLLYRRSAIGFGSHLRSVRDEHLPGSSLAAMTLVGLRAAIAAELPAPRPGAECVFDIRRESRSTRRAFGNWSAGVYLTSADDTSPVAVSASLTDARDAALPVMSSAAARARGSRGLSAAQTVAAASGAPRLTLSFTQAHGPIGDFPGIDEARSVIALATTPNGPESITLTVLERRGTLHLNVSFYPDVWERAAVERAVDSFLADPVPYLGLANRGVEVSP